MDALRLSVDLKQLPVVLQDSAGVERQCMLKELIGRDRNGYLSKLTARMKVDKNGKATGVKSFDGFQADLLTLCFYDENNELFSKEDIEELPSSTQQMLFDKAQELSGLNIEAGEQE